MKIFHPIFPLNLTHSENVKTELKLITLRHYQSKLLTPLCWYIEYTSYRLPIAHIYHRTQHQSTITELPRQLFSSSHQPLATSAIIWVKRMDKRESINESVLLCVMIIIQILYSASTARRKTAIRSHETRNVKWSGWHTKRIPSSYHDVIAFRWQQETKLTYTEFFISFIEQVMCYWKSDSRPDLNEDNK